ncbi:MAG: DUF4062 domain-containing protein [Pyrinomonadaceae bacterium]|nr:DUF4062 domain-containing protein [Pyrinomonadaceae bacterium]
MAKIYISSTYSDLKDCRKAVYVALRSMRHDVIAMEDYVASDQRPLNKCLADVAGCDIYLGVLAWRHGYIPKKDNPQQKSITELEFRHAVKTHKTCLLFLLDENAPWPVAKIDRGRGGNRIRKLRDEVSSDYEVSFFQNCDQLATLASNAVSNAESKSSAPRVDSDCRQTHASERISIARLPITGSDLFGRASELQQLDDAWANQKTNVLSLVAWGGVGKSSLVNHWLAQMATEDYRGASRVYAWSFYSQGTTDRAVSADQFFEAALTFFGHAKPNQGSPWDKGERLAQLVGRQRALLVLDGLEPLQYPPGPDEGRLKDQALQALLRPLAASNEGLCVISTRVVVSDLSSFEGHTAKRIDLDTLSPEAGAQVLKAQGVGGSQAEMEKASDEFRGHSLALTLLGSYLTDVCDGDVSRRVEVKVLEEDERYGRHAQRVMASYEKWLGEGPELAVLHVLGLFNRPADKNAVDSLRAAPAIGGLTDTLRPLSEHKWQQVLARLRRAKLLAERNPNQPGTLDAHPLVREHFGRKLKSERESAWKAGNFRLYKHYKKTAKVFPDTLEEMAPLYAAIAHGCEAGRHQEALAEVLQPRIHRGNIYFSTRNLGAYGADLTALSSFFNSQWNEPVSGLSATSSALVLSIAGYNLRALGKLRESTQPTQASLDATRSLNDWENAASAAITNSETNLTMGDLSQALSDVQEGVGFADQSTNSFLQFYSRTALACVLHQAGRLSESEDKFQEVEKAQEKLHPEFELLHAFSGFQYCDLLLDQGKYQEVQVRSRKTIKLVASRGYLADIARDHLSMGRAYLLQARREHSRNFAKATDYLRLAVDGLREAGTLHHLPLGLLAHAELCRVTDDFARAQEDLNEATNIAIRGSMGLYEADCHLEYAWLYLAMSGAENKAPIKQENREKALEHWDTAREMIERMGYHRRDQEVREIAQLLEQH